MKYHFLVLLLLIFFSGCHRQKEIGVDVEEKRNEPQKSSNTLNHNDSDSIAYIKIQRRLKKLVDSVAGLPEMKNATFGFIISDDNNNTLAQYNENKSLIPASSLKALTTATALEILKQDFRFITRLEYSGYIDTSLRVLYGNLYLRGGGDPAFGSRKYKDNYYKPDFLDDWIRIIKTMGIDSITGSVIADAQIFDTEIVPTSWTWEDIAAYYGTAASGLSVYDNTFRINFKVDHKGSYSPDKDSIFPYIPGLVLENKIRTSSGEFYLDILGAYYNDYRVIHGVVPKGRDRVSIRASMPDPPFVAAYALEQKLKKAGILVKGDATTIRRLISKNEYKQEDRLVLALTKSPSLIEIINETNLNSNNLYAEHLIKYLGCEKRAYGSDDSGSIAIRAFWGHAGLDTEGLSLYDGSGISRKNHVTAKFLNDMLFYMHSTSKNNVSFFNSLPVSGQSGTLKSFGKNTPLEGRLHAKSGSMSGVKSYTGYLENGSGSIYNTTVIVNNYSVPTKEIKRILIDLYNSILEILDEL